MWGKIPGIRCEQCARAEAAVTGQLHPGWVPGSLVSVRACARCSFGGDIHVPAGRLKLLC